MRSFIRRDEATSNHATERAALGVLLAAALFGSSAPTAKRLLADVDSTLLACLLYVGSGIALTTVESVRVRRGGAGAAVTRADATWLAAAVVVGGAVAPFLLLWGLARASASSASLALALEAPLTALVARVVFGEHVGRRTVLALLFVCGALYVIAAPNLSGSEGIGLVAVALAAACWALDNNLTREITSVGALRIGSVKGLAGGAVNGAAALWLGAHWPSLETTLGGAILGAIAYGLSLVLFVRALGALGSARTAAYFSAAPFFGVLGAVVLLGEPATWRLGVAAGLIVVANAWLLGERHSHWHRHEPLDHFHSHVHDEHHRHRHEGEALESHAHGHRHETLEHDHPHAPDVHHRHGHDRA